MHCIFNTIFFLFHFNFGSTTNSYNGNSSCKLSKSFLKFFCIIIRSSFFDLSSNLITTTFYFFFLAGTLHNCSIFFIYHKSFSAAKHINSHILKFNSKIFTNNLAASKNCNIFQHCFSSISEARSFDSRDL